SNSYPRVLYISLAKECTSAQESQHPEERVMLFLPLQRIGDSYRGYCLSEAELLSVLGQHKQQTQSVWGTRQSPSPAKAASRLMWKSQYVPYDGIPFVNAGSRAIVMECQYGPRRKGTQPKKTADSESVPSQVYKATCPARIYIKKVKKFPNYRVPTDPKIDKKMIRMEQEKSFNLLKKDLDATEGVLRWYVQLPDQDAHQYHHLETGWFSPSPNSFQQNAEEEVEIVWEESAGAPSRLHPRVAEKIRELVASGIEEVYSVRKQLRKFVERELFKPDEVPERHNLSYFPTVNDLRNHIHEAQVSLGTGELIYDSQSSPTPFQWTADNGNVLNEVVTVTFETQPQEESLYILKGLQLQPSFTSTDGTTALITMNQSASSFASPEGTTTLIAVNPPALENSGCLLNSEGSRQPLVLSHLHSQSDDQPLSSVTSLPSPGHNMVSMGQLVEVKDATAVDGEVHQILLGQIHPIPITIVETEPTIGENHHKTSVGEIDIKLYEDCKEGCVL
uniref:Calcium responsive transcription factor n=1 Tax=Leptobrachium leishanense TaxID=445787 RepID=A0A8C5PGF0_9ANUR